MNRVWLGLFVVVACFSSRAEAEVTGRETRFDLPTFFWAGTDDRSVPPHLTPEQAARHHLGAHAELYRLSPAALARTQVSSLHDLHDGTAVIVTFQQRIGAVRVFRDEMKVVMNQKLELIALSGFLTPFGTPLGLFSLRPESALASAHQDLSGQSLAPETITSRGLLEGGYTGWHVEGARSVRTRPVYFPLPTGLVPSFYGELEISRGWFSFVVSAIDGRVLYEKDLTASHRYAVWADPSSFVPWPGPPGPTSIPHPFGAPTGFTPPWATQQFVTLENAGLSTNDPWLAPGALDTSGNNVRAYADREWPNGFTAGVDVLAPPTSADAFEWISDPTLAPAANSTQTRAAIVQLFYTTNFLHDWFYDDGFTERAGNAQLSNLGRGGQGNDPLLAEAQDWSGFSNANMATPSDGQSPRMQMYLFVASSGPAHDGTIDNGVVAHEWGHYISNRLVGDSNGLSASQSYGMGEGWGDFHAALMLVNAADATAPGNTNWEGAFSLSGWASQSLHAEAYYYGLRRYPLSASFQRNPLTFKFIDDSQPRPSALPIFMNYGRNSEVHNTGEVWAVMLWECYVELLRDPRLTFDQAQARMKRYLVAAYKATPLIPTFTEGRDALLAVAVANDPLDFVHFWAAFARRGLGRGAIAADRYDTNNYPVTESFSVGNEAQFLSLVLDDSGQSCDGDRVLDRDEGGKFTVQLRNVGTSTLTGTTFTISSTLPGISFPAGASWPVPDLAAFATTTLEIPVALTGVVGVQLGTFQVSMAGAALGPVPVTRSVSFPLNFDEQVAVTATDTVETAGTAWTPGSDPALDKDSGFRRVTATTTQHFWFAPSPVTTGDSWLLSPPLQVGSSPFRVIFNHRHEFELNGAELLDGAVIELSTDDGVTWSDVGAQATPPYPGTISSLNSSNPLRGRQAFTGRSARYPAFLSQTLDFGTTLANRTVRLRFRVGGDDGSATPTRGWELDDFQFLGLTNTPFGSRVTDSNLCSNHPPVPTPGVEVTADEGARVVLVASATDADGDPVTLSWEQTSGPLGVLNGAVFIAPEVAADATITFALTANDGRVSSSPVEQRVLVKNVNRVPRASSPPFLEGNSGEALVVKGSGSDSDGEPLTFEWTRLSGPEVALVGATTDTLSVVLPEVSGTAELKLQLVVRDASSASAPVVTTVVVHGVVSEVPGPEAPKGCGCSETDLGAIVAMFVFLKRRRAAR